MAEEEAEGEEDALEEAERDPEEVKEEENMMY